MVSAIVIAIAEEVRFAIILVDAGAEMP